MVEHYFNSFCTWLNWIVGSLRPCITVSPFQLSVSLTLSDMQRKPVLSLVLATVYRPPGPYTDFLKEFSDFLSDLLGNVDKALIVGDFNIHVDNTNDALGLAFTNLINSFGVKQNVTGPTHRFNHTLDLIIAHGIDLTDIDIVPQSDNVTDLSLYRACYILLILTIWLRVIVQAELLFQPLKIDSQITCWIYLNYSVYP